jgi:outer membrane protein OmpU
MNNLKKVGLSALAGSLAMVNANAIDMTVTGEAQAVYSTAQHNETGGEASNGKGIGVDTDLHFNASGELDNGFTISVAHVLDTDTNVTNSSTQLAVGMGSLGTIQFNDVGGASSNGIDDVLPFAYEEPWDGTSTTSEFNIFGSQLNKGSVTYKTPSYDMMGVTMSATYDYDPSASDTAPPTAGAVAEDGASAEAFTVTLAHESGLTIGGGHSKVADTNATKGEEGATGYIKYSNGGLSVGYQEFYYDAAHKSAEGADSEGDGYAIAYTAGDVSISYGVQKETKAAVSDTAALLEEELSAFQAAYTMGGMTIAASLYETDNVEGVTGIKYEETELSVSFAF